MTYISRLIAQATKRCQAIAYGALDLGTGFSCKSCS